MHAVCKKEHACYLTEKAACISYVKKEPCMPVGPGKWWSEMGEASTHVLAHVFTSNCVHTVCRHIGVT